MNNTQKYNLLEILQEKPIIDALNNNDFQAIYKRLEDEDGNITYLKDLNVPAFTEMLFKAGIDPLPHLEEIPYYFATNMGIESIKIPEGITRIDESAFLKCKKLKYVTLPNTLEVISTNAFRECESLEEIRLPKSVQILGDNIFFYCTSLKKIYIESPLEEDYVGEDIFDRCLVLKDIYYGGDITSWGNLNRDSIHTPPKTIIHCTDGNYKYDIENDSWYEVT